MAALALLMIGNLMFTFRINTQLNAMVHATPTPLLALDGQPDGYSATAQTRFTNPQSYAATGSRYSNASPTALVAQIQQLKQRAAKSDPTKLAVSENRLLAVEPSLPAVEQRNTAWLNTTLANLPDDLPRAVAPQASCQGRRCVIEAAFEDETAAREWASRYLLAAGGKQLQNSRAVVLPLGTNASQGVTMRLYLH